MALPYTRRTRLLAVFVLVFCSFLSGPIAFGQVGVGATVSTLGIGGEFAVALGKKANVRAGANFFNYNKGFNKDSITYAGQLRLRSATTQLDWFPFGGGFHLSPGAMLYNGNQVTLGESVPAGQSFTLGGTQYYSNPANPITGTGQITFNKAAPMITMGFGNLVQHGSRHFSIPFEVGAVLEGSPIVGLNLAGSACTNGTFGPSCASTSTPAIQASVAAEQTKISSSLKILKYYPIVSLGFGYKF